MSDTTTTATIDPPAPAATDAAPETLPAVEAFAQAIAVTAHQHEAALGHEEDAPRELVQVPLPIPRPPFDYRAAVVRIAEKEEAVEGLARLLEQRKKAYTGAKADWEEAAKELQALIRQTTREMRAKEQSPEERQLELPHSSTCAFERDNPGQTCMVCHQEREAVRQREADANAEIAQAIDADAPVGVIVHWHVEDTDRYLSIQNGSEVDWTEDVSLAAVFDDEEDARTNLRALGISIEELVFLPDPMAADPAAAATVADPVPDAVPEPEPLPEPEPEPEPADAPTTRTDADVEDDGRAIREEGGE